MHIFIITDLEGIAGVDTIGIMDEESECYRKAVENLMEDTNAAVAGAFVGGADKVTVVDGHHTGFNFIEGMLDPRAIQIPASVSSNMDIKDYDMDAIFAVGAHAMAGTVDAFLDHTQSAATWFDYRINGKSLGEMGQQAACYGLRDVPLIMASGDEAACREAEELIPGIVTACVKKAKGRNTAECIPLEEARERIFNAAKEAVMKAGEIKPYKIDFPVTVEITFCRNDYCDEAHKSAPQLIRNGRTLIKKLEEVKCYRELAWYD